MAQILSLVINMENGVIKNFEWSNGCYNSDCDINNCKETNGTFNDTTYVEQNCYVGDCSSTSTQCDTKVYVTWTGDDNKNRNCISDNYRISHFTGYSINSLLQSAYTFGEKVYGKLT